MLNEEGTKERERPVCAANPLENTWNDLDPDLKARTATLSDATFILSITEVARFSFQALVCLLIRLQSFRYESAH